MCLAMFMHSRWQYSAQLCYVHSYYSRKTCRATVGVAHCRYTNFCSLEQARKSSTGSRRESNDAASVKSGTSHRSSRSSRSTRPLVSGRSKRDIETGDNLLSNAAGLPGAPVREAQTDINRYGDVFNVRTYIHIHVALCKPVR
jgi:hypothetical protein